MSIRLRLIKKILNFKKGKTFVLGDVYDKNAFNLDTARRRLGELVEQGIVSRVKPGVFKVTCTVNQRKYLRY